MSKHPEPEPGCGPESGLDPDAWFPLSESDVAVEVLAICAACSLRRMCLSVALTRGEAGIWAGTTTLDRAHGRAALRLGVAAGTMLDQLLDTAVPRATVTHDDLTPEDWTPAEPVAS